MKIISILLSSLLFVGIFIDITQAASNVEIIGYSYADNSLYSIQLPTLHSTKIGTLQVSGDLWGLARASEHTAYIVERASDFLYTINLTDASTVASVQLDQDIWGNGRGMDISPQGELYGVFNGVELRTI